jgi:hypothetical protein
MTTTTDPRTFGIYCRTGEHERCAMNPCGCPHHNEILTRASLSSWNGLPQSEPTVTRLRNWTADFATNVLGQRICPNDGCGKVLAHTGGRYPRQCEDCKRRGRSG